MTTDQSQKLFEEAQQLFPGGVNSPVRAFRSVGGSPLFFAKGSGAQVWDADGNSYIDYVGSWGAALLGHAHPSAVAAVQAAVTLGFGFGAPHAIESQLAQLVQQCFPALEKMRFVSSGTEATMSALRVARGFTKRDKIIKFAGCYHGHADALLVKAGSGAATFGTPDSLGVPADFAQHTLVARYNHLQSVEALFDAHPNAIAAVIIEPVVGNMGVVPPQRGFLNQLQELCRAKGALLIIDEVMTGFRLARGGATELFGLAPDLVCLGKVVGGGLPVGVYGGRKEIMEQISPLGGVYQAGTLSGNPIAMAAGLATLKELMQPGFYPSLQEKTAYFTEAFRSLLSAKGLPWQLQTTGSMWTLFFTETPVVDWESAAKSNTSAFGRFFHAALEKGISLPPSQFESAFISFRHEKADFYKTLNVFDAIL